MEPEKRQLSEHAVIAFLIAVSLDEPDSNNFSVTIPKSFPDDVVFS